MLVAAQEASPGQGGDPVPVGLVRADQDHCVVCGAAAERPGARVEDATLILLVLRVAFLLRLVLVVPDVEVPAQRLVLRGEGVEGGHVVVVRQAVGVAHAARCACERARIAAGFEHQDLGAGLGEAGRDRAAAGTRADDDIVEVPVARLGAHRHWPATAS